MVRQFFSSRFFSHILNRRCGASCPATKAGMLIVVLTACEAAPGAAVVTSDFDTVSGGFENAVEVYVPHISATPWTGSDGSLTNFTGNPGRALGATGWHDGNAFSFSLTVEPGFALDLTGFSFDERASSAGPRSWGLSIAGQPLASGDTNTGTSFVTRAGPLNLAGLGGTVAVVLQGSVASSAAGTWRIDNVAFEGQVTPIPLPAPFGLLAAGCVALVASRRRRYRQ